MDPSISDLWARFRSRCGNGRSIVSWIWGVLYLVSRRCFLLRLLRRGDISPVFFFQGVEGVEREDERMLWCAARECRRFLEEGIRSERDQIVGLLRFVSDFKGYLLGRLGGVRDNTFEVTNIGVLDGGLGNGEGKARFDDMVFSSGLCTYGDPFCVSVVSVKGGRMTVGVNWVTGVTGDEDARAMGGWLEGSLNGIAKDFVPGGDVYFEPVVKGKDRGVGKRVGVWTAAGVIVAGLVAWMLV